MRPAMKARPNVAPASLSGQMLLALCALFTMGLTFVAPAQASSCLVDTAAAARLAGKVGELKPIDPTRVLVRPCRGQVNGADATVLFSRGAGITRMKVVRPGQELSDEVPQPLVELAMPGGPLATIFNLMNTPRAQRPGSKRFDDVEVLMLGGQLLAGAELKLPLARFGWDAAQPVQLQGPDQRLTSLLFDRGLLLIPALQPGGYRLVQGSRSAPLEVLAVQGFGGLEAELAEIGKTSTDPSMRALREMMLLWEQGLLLNAVAADARR